MTRVPWTLVVVLVAVILISAAPAQSQLRGVFLPLDHPTYPVAEWLVARGTLNGLDGSQRPFPLAALRRSVGRALEAAGPDGPSPSLAWLAAALLDPLPDDAWGASLELGVGALAYTDPSRELLLADDGAGRVVDLQAVRLGAEFGPASFQIEPRRLMEGGDVEYPVALGRAEWRWGWIQWGQVDRSWGPPGVTGLLIGPLAPPRSEFAFGLGPEALRFEHRAAVLSDGVSRETGDPLARHWASHRLRWRPVESFEMAIWETTLSAEEGGADAARFSPFVPFALFAQEDRDDERNVVIGLDATWRISPSLLLETQLALDDFIDLSDDDNPYPHRYGFTFQARGPAGESGSWRAYATALSGLALNTFDPAEAYLNDDLGLGRLRPDHWEAGAFWTAASGFSPPDSGSQGGTSGDGALDPRRVGWPGQGILSGGVRWRRQGLRSFTDPFPDLETGEDRLPAFSSEIERQVWALVAQVDWLAGPVVLQGEAQLQRRSFPVSGSPSDWGLEARVQLVWRFGPWSWLRS